MQGLVFIHAISSCLKPLQEDDIVCFAPFTCCCFFFEFTSQVTMRSTRSSLPSAFVSASSFSPSPLKAFCCYFPVAQSRSYCSTASSDVDGLVLGVFKGGRLSSAAKALDDATNGEISKRLKLADSMKGDTGNSLLLLNLSPKHPRVALMGLGKDPTVVRTALFLFLTHSIRWIARGKGNPRS